MYTGATLEDNRTEAQKAPDQIAVVKDVSFPSDNYTSIIIKEIAQTQNRETFYVGRSYPEDKFK